MYADIAENVPNPRDSRPTEADCGKISLLRPSPG